MSNLHPDLFESLRAAGDIISVRGRFYVAIDTLPKGTKPVPTPPPPAPEPEPVEAAPDAVSE